MVFNCWICAKLLPAMYKHTHHKIPQATGGADTPGNLVELCPGCHDALHNVAYRLLSAKHSLASIRSDVSMIYQNAEASARCFELACLVRDAEVAAREGLVEGRSVHAAATTLSTKAKNALRMRTKELGISQEAYLRSLVLSDLIKAYGASIASDDQLLLVPPRRVPARGSNAKRSP